MADAAGVDTLNVEKESSADQQVQHLSHLCSSQSFLYFLYLPYFILFLH
jgi:hypothetical protein